MHARPRGRWGSVAAILAALFSFVAIPVGITAATGNASAATNSASTLTKTGTDATTGSTASSTNGSVGTTEPGDAINWVLHYTNNTGSPATVDETDPVTGSQTYVPGSLKTPPDLSAQYSTNGGSSYQSTEPASGVNAVGATGTVPANTTTSASPNFAANNLTFTTPGGDGYTVEGYGPNIYTVFHHTGPNQGPGYGATVVYCATLAGAVCPNWPSQSSYVSTTSGAPIGTGGIPQTTTGGENGSFIANGNLYWPVEDLNPVNGSYPVGMMCLNLTTLDSCGLTQLDTLSLPPQGGTAALISGDGIAASNGNYYYFDGNGDMLCFAPGTGACGVTNVTNGQTAGNTTGYLGSIITAGQYVYQTYITNANPTTGLGGTQNITCFDTTSSSTCPGFPIAEGTAIGNNPDYVAPILAASGALQAVCDVALGNCYTPSGATLANPYTGYTGFGDLSPGPGFGSGVIVGSKFYTAYPTNTTDANTTTVLCFDFAGYSGSGPVPTCSGFSGPVDAQNYTVRTLANLPGCMAADGNAGQIVIFNEQTGGSCVTASASVALTPSKYYCDGQSGDATSWGKLDLTGLTGSEYASATVTLQGVNGPVAGFTNLTLSPGQTSLDLSSLPVSGNTASLTAQVTLSGVTNTTAVNASNVSLSWTGGPIETCFQTTVANVCPPANATVSNTGNVVTTGTNGVTDGPGGTSSGTATFDIVPTAAQCALTFTKTPSEQQAYPGDTVTYTLTVTNSGTVPWPASNPAGFTDDLTNVLTDAAYNNDASATAGNVSYTQPTISWSGPLAAGASAAVTYSVKVDNPDTGPHNLANTLTPVCPAYASCTAPPAVDVPVAKYNVKKLVSVADATPGQTVKYTITVTNAGKVPYTATNPATLSDDLTNDLVDSTYDKDAAATAGTATYTAPDLAWSGPLAVGGTDTITYSVKVDNPDPAPHVLANTVTGGSDCTPPSSDPADCSTTTPIYGLNLVKTTSKKVVDAGSAIDYTVKVTNTGDVAYTTSNPASFTDSLAKDLSNGTYGKDAKASAGTVSYSAPDLKWSGPLGIGKSATVTYSVLVNSPDTGNHKLTNTVVSNDPGSNCPTGSTDPSCSTATPVREYTVTKTASPAAVAPGGKVTYTIKVTNTGAVAYTAASPAKLTDDLSGDLGDARYDHDANATRGSLSYAAPKLSWSGPLGVGRTATITYTVTVASPDSGSHKLLNTVTTPAGYGGDCDPPSPDPSCATTTPIKAYTVTKTASTANVAPGGKVTYTIVVHNTGQYSFTRSDPATFSDNLSEVLSNAVYDNDASASAGSASYKAPTLSWSGPLSIGGTARITYSVTVNNPDNGSNKLTNTVVTPDGSGGDCNPGATDASCTAATAVDSPGSPAPSPGAASAPGSPSSPEHPLTSIVTGHGLWGPGGPTNTLLAVAGGLLLLAGGAGLIGIRRRRTVTRP